VTYHLAVPLTAGSNDLVIFQVDSNEVSDSQVLASDDGEGVVDKAKKSLEQALNDLKPSLNLVKTAFTDLEPDETSVDFGLSVSGEYGMVIAKGTAEVNFAVHMSWKRPATTQKPA
jgi:hypothetical protein